MESYWWAKAKGDTGMGLPWDIIESDLSNPDKLGDIEAQQDVDPYGRYPCFPINIRHPNKPITSKLAVAAKEAAKKGPRKPKKIVVGSESDDKLFRTSVLDVMNYDPDQLLEIYPTIKEGDEPPGGIDDKCNRIHTALALSKNECDKQLINVYGTLSVIDRAYVPQRYKEMHGVNLRQEMDKALTGDFGHLIGLLSMPIEEVEVMMIKEILKRTKKDNHLSRILCGRSNVEMNALQAKYREITKTSLEDKVLGIIGKLSGIYYYLIIYFDAAVDKYLHHVKRLD